MDPTGGSCMRSPQPPAPLWGCLRGADVPTAPGLGHCPPTPFSFHPKADFAAYSEFSASCLLSAAHCVPPEEQPPPFRPHPEWQQTATEARRLLSPGLALASGDAESPNLVSTAVAVSEDYEVPVNSGMETERKASKRKKEHSGRWRGSGGVRWDGESTSRSRSNADGENLL